MEYENGSAQFVDQPWGWRDRLRAKVFPVEPCSAPEAPHAKDCICTTVVVRLSWRAMFALLLSRFLKLEIKIACEHVVGETISASTAYPVSSAYIAGNGWPPLQRPLPPPPAPPRPHASIDPGHA